MPGRGGAFVMAEPSFVVVLTTPRGLRMLSHTSLMTYEEAEREADSWRHTPCMAIGAAGGNWAADVREVR